MPALSDTRLLQVTTMLWGESQKNTLPDGSVKWYVPLHMSLPTYQQAELTWLAIFAIMLSLFQAFSLPA